MDLEKQELPQENGQPSSYLVQLMLQPFDELTEIDYVHGRVRNLRHTEGKYFVPVQDASINDIRRYTAQNMVHPDDYERYLEESDPNTVETRRKHFGENGVYRSRYRFRLLGGGWRWVESISISGVQHGIPQGVCYVFLRDVQEEVDLAGESDAAAICDYRSELTGLSRENAFYKSGAELLRGDSTGWCVLAVDLEHFKLFNEWYGREQGDLLLAQVGAKLGRAEERSGGVACYFGQDDFALLAPYDRMRIEKLYADIHNLIIEYGTSVGFMPAFGISMADGKSTIYELYDRASMAARRAKDNYQTRIRVFEPSMYQKTDQDYRILSDFQKALEDRELFIVFQPQCLLENGKVVGAESLARWRRADGELIPPAVFVPVLERYGFVTDLDRYVWEEVCAWQKRLIDGGHTPLPVSVNVSQIDIYTIDVPEYFAGLIAKYGLRADSIKIEITESAYVDNDSVTDAVRRLREKGFMVLMDDFGSGYSSLNMLRNLNVDVIKLDTQFLRMNEDDDKGRKIMESIVDMAKTMGVPIIVEGVETQEEVDFLVALGCRYVQGFFFHRPMPAADFEALISDPKNVAPEDFRIHTAEQFRIRDFLDQNMFSDTVLNNILGPVAVFCWHGDDVDIVRYNEQFHREVKTPHFQRHTTALQKRVVREDVKRLYSLLKHAMRDTLDGASGLIRLNMADGSTAQLRVHFYYLDEDESGKRFYASVHDVTKFITLNDHMRLLSLLTPDSVVFLRKRKGELTFQTAAHGLESCLGLSREELERELYDGSFRERLVPEERERLLQQIVNSGMRMREFSEPFSVTAKDGSRVLLRMRFDSVRDRSSGVEYLLVMRKAEEEEDATDR